AVPKLSAALKPSSAQLLWIVDIYGFLIAGSLITMGTLGDRIGRRRLLLIGAAAFGVASVIAAFSTTAEMLIATRALLGVAGATLPLVAVLLVIYGLKRIAEHGLGWVAALTIVTGLVVGIVFLRRQRLLAHPLIDLHLFRSRAFSASLGVYLLATLVAFGAYIF